MDTGKIIKTLRKEKGITQQELGKRMGISQQQVAQYETGKLKPKLETLGRIAEALQVPRSSLLVDMSPLDKGELIKRDLLEILKNLNIKVDNISDADGVNNAIAEATNKKKHYTKLYDQLNDSGQNKAIEQVELLTKIPEYRKDPEE